MAERRVELHEPYVSASQQHAADMMGMYVFLATELMLFGGIFMVALGNRILHPHEVAEASRHLHYWLGAINTVVLLTSSLAVALAVHAARDVEPRRAAAWLAGAALLGVAFFGIKLFEYRWEYTEGLLPGFGEPKSFAGPVEQLHMDLYLIATCLHAFHLTIGVLLLSGLAWRLAVRSLPLPGRTVTVEVAGLYWHLVDVVWVFLYPVLYLAR